MQYPCLEVVIEHHKKEDEEMRHSLWGSAGLLTSMRTVFVFRTIVRQAIELLVKSNLAKQVIKPLSTETPKTAQSVQLRA
jgi:hypothetical protein